MENVIIHCYRECLDSMTESWHQFVKYKLGNMRKKYTCREVIFFFFSPGWRLGREQVLSYFSNERKGAEGFQFLEYYKGH